MSLSKKIFITGIPTAGKSTLAEILAKKVGGKVFSTDNLREEMKKDPIYKEWVEFYESKDEKEYYTTTSAEEQWNNLVKQSEALWPLIKERILSYDDGGKPIIFEGVNILPHLAKRDLPFSGIVLIGKSQNDVYERVKKDHRWGDTEGLFKLEAESFFCVERPKYMSEAVKYGYPCFQAHEDACDSALSLLNGE